MSPVFGALASSEELGCTCVRGYYHLQLHKFQQTD